MSKIVNIFGILLGLAFIALFVSWFPNPLCVLAIVPVWVIIQIIREMKNA